MHPFKVFMAFDDTLNANLSVVDDRISIINISKTCLKYVKLKRFAGL